MRGVGEAPASIDSQYSLILMPVSAVGRCKPRNATVHLELHIVSRIAAFLFMMEVSSVHEACVSRPTCINGLAGPGDNSHMLHLPDSLHCLVCCLCCT